MKKLYMTQGNLFETRQEAEKVVRGIPSQWGRAVGGPDRTIREVVVFRTAKEWQVYTGSHTWKIQ